MTNVVIADPGYLVRKGFKTIIEETEYISLIGEITYNINQGINMKTLNFLKTILIGYIILSFSYTNAQDKVGVLVIAHGGSTTWNEIVLQTIEPLKNNYNVEVAFGMANPKTMQEGINKLETQGVTQIVITQLFISSFSSIIRQNEYLLKLRKELADKPMLMDNPSHINEKMGLHPLNFNTKIYLTEPLNDHPLITEILANRISELSNSPKNETVIIVAHGPNGEKDNKNWIKKMENIADQLREKFKGENSFKNIFCMTVRDDAPKEIYKIAKENLRNIVNQASKNGRVIVVPLLLSQGGVENGIVKRLKGLNYAWSGKTLLPDANITKFIRVSVENALK